MSVCKTDFDTNSWFNVTRAIEYCFVGLIHLQLTKVFTRDSFSHSWLIYQLTHRHENNPVVQHTNSSIGDLFIRELNNTTTILTEHVVWSTLNFMHKDLITRFGVKIIFFWKIAQLQLIYVFSSCRRVLQHWCMYVWSVWLCVTMCFNVLKSM